MHKGPEKTEPGCFKGTDYVEFKKGIQHRARWIEKGLRPVKKLGLYPAAKGVVQLDLGRESWFWLL